MSERLPDAHSVFTWLIRNAGWHPDDSDDYVADVLAAVSALLSERLESTPCRCGTNTVCRSPVHPPLLTEGES